MNCSFSILGSRLCSPNLKDEAGLEDALLIFYFLSICPYKYIFFHSIFQRNYSTLAAFKKGIVMFSKCQKQLHHNFKYWIITGKFGLCKITENTWHCVALLKTIISGSSEVIRTLNNRQTVSLVPETFNVPWGLASRKQNLLFQMRPVKYFVVPHDSKIEWAAKNGLLVVGSHTNLARF